MWSTEEYDLGTIEGGQVYTIRYIYTGDKTIKSMGSSCGCMTPTNKKTSTGYIVEVKVNIKKGNKPYKKNGYVKVQFAEDDKVKILKFKSDVK